MKNEYNGSNVLVTGGAGFVGSRLVAKLSEFGANIVVLDDLSTGKADRIFGLPRCEFIKGTVCDIPKFSGLIENADFIFHLAAVNIIKALESPLYDFKVNAESTLALLEICREFNPTRVVFSSTASVYGNPLSLPVLEDHNHSALSPYAASKLSAEHYCNVFYELYNVPTVVLRYSNVYGTNQDPQNPYCGVISKFLDGAVNQRPLRIHGDGEQTRDFTYVEDAVEATLMAGVIDRAVGEVFNVSSGIETSINNLIALLREICETDFETVRIEKRDIDNVRRRVLSIEKIRKRLRWEPSTTLKQGLSLTKQWLDKVSNEGTSKNEP